MQGLEELCGPTVLPTIGPTKVSGIAEAVVGQASVRTNTAVTQTSKNRFMVRLFLVVLKTVLASAVICLSGSSVSLLLSSKRFAAGFRRTKRESHQNLLRSGNKEWAISKPFSSVAGFGIQLLQNQPDRILASDPRRRPNTAFSVGFPTVLNGSDVERPCFQLFSAHGTKRKETHHLTWSGCVDRFLLAVEQPPP